MAKGVRPLFASVFSTLERKTGGIEYATLNSQGNRRPRKIRELISDLENAGFVNRGGKGSHRNFTHPKVANPVTISGQLGADAKNYQERIVKYAVEESKK